MLKKCGLFMLTLALILMPSTVLALELGAEAKSDIDVGLSLENESKLTGSLTAEAEALESGQYKLLYTAELNNQSESALDNVDVQVNIPSDVRVSSYTVTGVEAEITDTEDGLLISLPQIEGNGSLAFQLEAFVETEQELEEIISPVAIQIDTEEVFTAELVISLTATAEETASDEDNTPNEEESTTEEEATEGNKDQAEELPKTGSAIGSWFWVTLGLLLIGSGIYLYRKSKVTIV